MGCLLGSCIAIGRVAIVKSTAIIGNDICTHCARVVAKEAFLAILLKAKINDTFAFVIIKPSQFGHITLFVDDLNLINHLSRNILSSSLYVISKKLLAINTNTFDFLTIDSHFTFLVDLNAVHFFEEIFHCSSLCYLIRRGIIFNCISFDSHLCRTTLYTYFGQIMYILYHSYWAKIYVLVFHFNPLYMIRKTHCRYNQFILTFMQFVNNKIAI